VRVRTASLPHGRHEAEDRHINFYNARDNLVQAATSVPQEQEQTAHREGDHGRE
jgi:hypothetical protein